MTFNICVIGCGEIAIGHHGPSYAKYAAGNPGVELAACCARHAETAARFAEQFGFKRAYTDYLQMLEQEHPDAVCLNVPPELICEFSCEILDRGLPLLLEKPPGLTVNEIDRMIASAVNSGAPHQVAFNRRFTPLTQALKHRLADELAPGQLQHVRVDFTRLNRTEADFSTTAIHGIDTARFLAGSDFAWARFHYQDLSSLGPGVANIFMDCTFRSGASGTLSFCPVAGVITERVTMHALNHSYYLNLPVWNAYDAPGSLLHIQDGQVVEQLTGPDTCGSDEDYILNGFYAENAAFFDDLRHGRAPADNLQSARQAVEIAQAMRERRVTYRISEQEWN